MSSHRLGRETLHYKQSTPDEQYAFLQGALSPSQATHLEALLPDGSPFTRRRFGHLLPPAPKPAPSIQNSWSQFAEKLPVIQATINDSGWARWRVRSGVGSQADLEPNTHPLERLICQKQFHQTRKSAKFSFGSREVALEIQKRSLRSPALDCWMPFSQSFCRHSASCCWSS